VDAYDVIIIGPGAGGGRSRGISPRPARRSGCSSEVTGFRASRRTGALRPVFVDNRYVSPNLVRRRTERRSSPGSHYFVGGGDEASMARRSTA
jgi:hypothetical protein